MDKYVEHVENAVEDVQKGHYARNPRLSTRYCGFRPEEKLILVFFSAVSRDFSLWKDYTEPRTGRRAGLWKLCGEGETMQKKSSRTVLESGRVKFVRLDKIRPNPSQPRRVFDPTGLQELADSIRQYGILQPLTVRRMPGGLELVAGERRLRAAKLAGLREVPCIFVTVDEIESGMLALVENLQRRDLDYIEEAEGLARLMRLYGLSQEQAAMKVGKSQSAVANKLRLLKHPPQVLEALRKGGFSERHARALLRLPVELRLEALEVMGAKAMTVAQAEQYIESLLHPATPAVHKPKYVLRDVRIFLNSLDKNVEIIRSAGIPCDLGREETEQEIVLTIRLPKSRPGKSA